MRTLHLKQIGAVWHYQRRRPAEYVGIEPRALIRFSLKTRDFQRAKVLAAEHSVALEKSWSDAKHRDESLTGRDDLLRHAAASEIQTQHGFAPKSLDDIQDRELLERMQAILTKAAPPPEQKAVLGLIEKPKLSLSQAFDLFWEHIQDEWQAFGREQRRVKRNVYTRSIRNFEKAVGPVSLFDIERRHALQFRSWWLSRVTKEGLKPYAGNREISCLRRLTSTIFDIESVEQPNPFARIRLKDTAERTRDPFETNFIADVLLCARSLAPLPTELQNLVQLMVNTGLRPTEAIGSELVDISLENPVPFIHIRANKIRALKTEHSERQIPLLGVSYRAARAIVAQGGWGKWAGKNMYATTVINRHFRESGLVTDPKQSLYSLRHWFQDQLTKRDVVDRAQAQLMGHKFQRPKYGFGKDLSELREIIAAFAID